MTFSQAHHKLIHYFRVKTIAGLAILTGFIIYFLIQNDFRLHELSKRGNVALANIIVMSLGIFISWPIWNVVIKLHGRKFKIFCSHCAKLVSADINWFCPHCDHENKVSPYFYRCGKCKRVPKSCECPHCGKLIDSIGKHNRTHYARFQRTKTVTIPTPDPRAERLHEHLNLKEKLHQEIEIAALERRLAQLKASPEFKRDISRQEALEKDFSDYEADIFGIRMIERKKRREYADEFKDSPENLEDAEMVVDAFVERHGMQPTRLNEKESQSDSLLG